MTASVIGSFRKHYNLVARAVDVFSGAGIMVLSPRKSSITNPDAEFVFLRCDTSSDPAHVQLVALHRILRSDFVYVVAPEGYVGRTTCYELGAIQAAGIPVYLSSALRDLPVCFPEGSVCSVEAIVQHLSAHSALPPLGRLHPESGTEELASALRRGALLDV